MSTVEDDTRIKAGIEEKGWKFVNWIRLPQNKNKGMILSKSLMNYGVSITHKKGRGLKYAQVFTHE
jgi:hypothetical protein